MVSALRGWPTHIPVAPPEGGLTMQSFVKCEDVRSISQDRLIKLLGVVSTKTMTAVEARVRVILGL